MMGMMPVAQESPSMTMHHYQGHHDQSHHDQIRNDQGRHENEQSTHAQLSDAILHSQSMQSGDHDFAHDMTCELLCAVSVSLLLHIDVVPQVSHTGQVWPVAEMPDYLPGLHTLLFKPPRI